MYVVNTIWHSLLRISTGQYLAADPKGRAIMIAAVEKQKLVYIFNRDGASKLTISSPLEAHKANTIIFSVVAVDVVTYIYNMCVCACVCACVCVRAYTNTHTHTHTCICIYIRIYV